MTARFLPPPAHRPVPRPRVVGLVAGVATVALLISVALVRAADASSTTPAHAPRTTVTLSSPTALTVTVGTTPTGAVVPVGAIGFSIDEDTMAGAGLTAQHGIVALMRRLGPSLLRVGGTTSQWGTAVAFPTAVLRSLDGVLKAAGWRIVLTENVAHYSAAVTTQDARDAHAILGAQLAGMACGNEPEGYESAGWRLPGYGIAQIVTEDQRCYAAIRAAAPGVPLLGPDSARAGWLHWWTAPMKHTVSVETTHLYPMPNCTTAWRSPGSLLGGAAERLALADVVPAVAQAHKAGLPLLLDETNSAACGGIHGVSNAYASALWAPDDVLTLLEAGVSGLDFHGSITAKGCHGYSPVCFPSGSTTVRAQPLYDGLLLAHDLGTGVCLPVTGGTDLLRTHALRRADGSTAVLLDNESGHPELVHLVLSRTGGAAAETLMTDPGGPRALGGVRFTAAHVEGGHGAGGTSYVVRLPAWSAAALVVAPSVAA